MEAVYVGTLDGIFKLVRSDGHWRIESRALEGAEVNAVAIDPRKRDRIFAGARGGGLYRSEDQGGRWQRLGEGTLSSKVRALSLDPSNPGTVYVGTEPPALWRSDDEGSTWKELEGVKRLAQERAWTYPVPVIEPHVRCIAVDPRNPWRLCLAAQVGGVVMSEDGGNSWSDIRYPIDMDVHSVVYDPVDPDLLYAATGGGENFPDPTPPPKGRPLYRYSARKKSWECITEGFDRTYSVPVGVHPGDTRILYIGVAEEPPPRWLDRPTKANGALMRSTDAGESWQQLAHGLPNPFASMVECISFDPDDPDHLFIGTGGEGARFIRLQEGEIYHSRDRGDHWEKIPVQLPIVYAMAVR